LRGSSGDIIAVSMNWMSFAHFPRVNFSCCPIYRWVCAFSFAVASCGRNSASQFLGKCIGWLGGACYCRKFRIVGCPLDLYRQGSERCSSNSLRKHSRGNFRRYIFNFPAQYCWLVDVAFMSNPWELNRHRTALLQISILICMDSHSQMFNFPNYTAVVKSDLKYGDFGHLYLPELLSTVSDTDALGMMTHDLRLD
jgi:hypothetical protein